MYKDNTYLTDLKVGSKVIEHHKTSGLRYVSKVVSIDDKVIVVSRNDGTKVSYGTHNGMILYPYGTQVPNFYLMQYDYTTDNTPFNPGDVASDAEVLIPNYGNE